MSLPRSANRCAQTALDRFNALATALLLSDLISSPMSINVSIRHAKLYPIEHPIVLIHLLRPTRVVWICLHVRFVPASLYLTVVAIKRRQGSNKTDPYSCLSLGSVQHHCTKIRSAVLDPVGRYSLQLPCTTQPDPTYSSNHALHTGK